MRGSNGKWTSNEKKKRQQMQCERARRERGGGEGNANFYDSFGGWVLSESYFI